MKYLMFSSSAIYVMFTFKSDTILIVFMIVQVEVVISSNQTQELSIKYIFFMYDCSIIDKARGLPPTTLFKNTPPR